MSKLSFLLILAVLFSFGLKAQDCEQLLSTMKAMQTDIESLKATEAEEKGYKYWMTKTFYKEAEGKLIGPSPSTGQTDLTYRLYEGTDLTAALSMRRELIKELTGCLGKDYRHVFEDDRYGRRDASEDFFAQLDDAAQGIYDWKYKQPYYRVFYKRQADRTLLIELSIVLPRRQ